MRCKVSDLNKVCENCGKPCDDSIEANNVGWYCCSMACVKQIVENTHPRGIPLVQSNPKFEKMSGGKIWAVNRPR